MASTIVSAPGKVLLAGGYLVLDQQYSGLVVGTSSRFYCAIKDAELAQFHIRVRSPQFLDAEWLYAVAIEGVAPRIQQVGSGSRNKFVQLAIERTLLLASELKGIDYLREKIGGSLDIIIVGDNDFYSQRKKLESLNLPRTISSLQTLDPFLPVNTTLSNVHKTGLGSSAALTTSLVTSLLLHIGIIQVSDFATSSKGLTLAHNLSQYVHCFAQGKVGSGFDVSSAIYGSHVYKRFNPSVLEPLMVDVEALTDIASFLTPSNGSWDEARTTFQLPPLIRLVLADVDAGSDTPSLVGKVLKWRRENPEEAANLWNNLNTQNQKLPSIFHRLSQLYTENGSAYQSAAQQASVTPAHQWPTLLASQAETAVLTCLHQAYQVTESIREHMRNMGTLAGVPIEPPEQTRVLDASVALSGVVGGGVPGAGGYDAIWLLVIEISSNSTPLNAVENLWINTSELHITPLLASESKEGGVNIEDAKAVPGLTEVLGG